MDTLLNAKFGDKDIKCGIQHTNHLSLADDRAIALGEVGDENTQEEMSRLLLCEGSRVSFAVIEQALGAVL